MLTRADFDVAVKEALRRYTRADLLLGSPLLETRIVAEGGSKGAHVDRLRQVLADAAQAIFVSERDQKLQRILELTYFRPARKQEAAAERLGLSFSTYRRHLTAAVERLTEWLWRREQEVQPANDAVGKPDIQSHPGNAAGQPPERPRLSVVVLPFLNLSQDPNLDYLVDGIVDNLLTDLSRALPGSFVVSRSTAFAYKGRKIPTRQIGEELQVRYILEGSTLANANRVRVNAQLIDAETDEHLWAERFDKERRDMLEVQDEVVARLARTVGVEMVRHGGRRHSRTDGPDDVVDLVMRGNALTTQPDLKAHVAEAVALFKRALELDPDNADAMIGIASARIFQVVNLYQIAARESLLDEAETLISRAMSLAVDHVGVMKARAMLLRARGRFADAIIAVMSVIALNPGEPTAYRELGLNNLYLGRPQEAVDWFRRADRVAPMDRERWTWLQGLGRALMQLGQDAAAAEALRLAMHTNPHYVRGRAYLAAAEALSGNIERAKVHFDKLQELDPGMTIRRFVEERNSVPLDAVSPAYLRGNDRLLEGLRRAGMPEQ